MIFAFLVSFLSFFYIDIGGNVYITEILLAGYLFFSINNFRLLFGPLPRKILLFGFLWLISQIVTDLICETSAENYLRGWAAIIFFLIDFCAVNIMVQDKPNLLRVLILGSALGAIFGVIFFPSEYSEIEPWKFGYGFPVTMLVLLFLSTGFKYKASWSPMLLGLLGALGIHLNARSLGGITLLTAFVLYISNKPVFSTYIKQKKLNLKKFFSVGIMLLIPIYVIVSFYEFAAESGYLPENVISKYELNKNQTAGLIGTLLSGRPEILISSQAVIDSPIIGHGSWAENQKYSHMIYDVVDMLKVDASQDNLNYNVQNSSLIPAHSVIMQAWIWAGFLGAFFWFFVLQYVARNFLAALKILSPLRPIIIFTSIYAIWNLFFSPFGSSERFYWAMVLIIIFSANTNVAVVKGQFSNRV